jgi:glycosyltransferase involved in cell wall biosynthesis
MPQVERGRCVLQPDERAIDGARPVAPTISIVVPTKDEAGNIRELLRLLDEALGGEPAEVIFVDDSTDGTADVVRDEIERRRGQAIRLIHRAAEDRVGGLGGAVVAGMRLARAQWVCVMDADLQHPPDLVPQLLRRAAQGDVDAVVASRFCSDGHADEFGRGRRLLSRSSTLLAARLFSRDLRNVTDPMSGFFLVRRSAVDLDALRPHGFKILLEILVRSRLRVAEVPFSFGVRFNGESKASAKEGARYLRQLWRLRLRNLSLRFGRFGLVGASGLVVNTAVFALLADVVGVWYLAAAVIATQGSSLWNFALTERWVFRGRDHRLAFGSRLAAYIGMNNIALVLRVPMLLMFVSALGMHHLPANVVSLVILTLVRFGVADTWIWATAAVQRTFNYDIHGIVTIVSEARLPELQRFQVDAVIPDPVIRVRIGRVRARGVGATELDDDRTLVHYVEVTRNLGFGAEIELGEQISIVATPLLRHSPHVLYTNVVEPVLRWTFVERGYALVHAACMAKDDQAFLITARTDTGKTTTALRALDTHPYSFLSDDLTLITPDGRALTYPKPLTISRHTLAAVRTPLLSLRERTTLIVQSRLHSRSGRLFGLVIAKTHLPAATINAVVQMIVPPPKYQVERLVPGVAVQPEAHIAALTIIQREGDEGVESLTGTDALDILLSNCEDAYGFPPYPVIRQWLTARRGRDLQAVERAIITEALAGKPAHLLSSYERNWYRMFPAIVEKAASAVIATGAAATDRDEALGHAPAAS